PAQAGRLSSALHVVFNSPSVAAFDRFNPLSNVIQMIFDGADPGPFAAAITHPTAGRPHDVWLVEVLRDETVSNASTELLAYVMALPQITPAAEMLPGLNPIAAPVMANLAMGATGGYFQLAPATHGANLDN